MNFGQFYANKKKRQRFSLRTLTETRKAPALFPSIASGGRRLQVKTAATRGALTAALCDVREKVGEPA